MHCPFCFKEARFRQERRESWHMPVYLCPNCRKEVPGPYVRHDHNYPPVAASVIGYRGHGKTRYCATLFKVLKEHVSKHWPTFYAMEVDEESRSIVQRLIALLQGASQSGPIFSRPVLMRMHGIPFQTNCTWLCYDPAGEPFTNPTRLVQYVSFMQRAQTAMFLISIPDLEDAEAPRAMHDLLNVYVLGMRGLSVSTQGQHLIVVFTKADAMAARFSQPWGRLWTYLIEGSTDSLAHPKGYMKQMRVVSAQLREFTRRELRAAEFINMAETCFRSVEFSVVSTIGAKLSGKPLPTEISSCRVLDPLLWTMEKSLPNWRQTWRRWWG